MNLSVIKARSLEVMTSTNLVQGLIRLGLIEDPIQLLWSV